MFFFFLKKKIILIRKYDKNFINMNVLFFNKCSMYQYNYNYYNKLLTIVNLLNYCYNLDK